LDEILELFGWLEVKSNS